MSKSMGFVEQLYPSKWLQSTLQARSLLATNTPRVGNSGHGTSAQQPTAAPGIPQSEEPYVAESRSYHAWTVNVSKISADTADRIRKRPAQTPGAQPVTSAIERIEFVVDPKLIGSFPSVPDRERPYPLSRAKAHMKEVLAHFCAKPGCWNIRWPKHNGLLEHCRRHRTRQELEQLRTEQYELERVTERAMTDKHDTNPERPSSNDQKAPGTSSHSSTDRSVDAEELITAIRPDTPRLNFSQPDEPIGRQRPVTRPWDYDSKED